MTETTHERPIADILGWERLEVLDPPVPVDAWGVPEVVDGDTWWTRRWSGPTVDDLLAWLHDGDGQRHRCFVHNIEPDDRSAGWRVVVYPPDTEYLDEHFGPTLLAALEAAVRAVDGAT